MRDIRSEIDKINEIVPFPTVVAQIMSELLKEETATEKIVQLIETDAVLTARILRAANSPYYGLRWEVNNITRAVVLLGFEEVSRLVLIYQMKQRVFALSPDQRSFLELLWKHSVATAAVSRMLALFVDFRGEGKEFTAGLMHDLGKIVLVQYFADTLTVTQSMIRELGMKDVEAELQSLAIDHCEIGGQLGEKWGIPPVFVEVMRHHHTPETAPNNQSLVALVRFADLLSERWGSGIGEQPMNFNLEEDESWKVMRKHFPRLAEERADAVEQKLLALYEMNQEFIRLFA